MARDLLLAPVPRFTLALGREACCPFCPRAYGRASVACVRADGWMDLALGSWELYRWQDLDRW